MACSADLEKLVSVFTDLVPRKLELRHRGARVGHAVAPNGDLGFPWGHSGAGLSSAASRGREGGAGSGGVTSVLVLTVRHCWASDTW